MELTLQLEGVSIRCDKEGRFCLNDFHHASGGDQRHRVNYWANLEATQELIQSIKDLQNAGIPAITEAEPISVRVGRNGGTFVCEELVYDYAMWVSSTFRLKVIRVFKDIQKAELEKARLESTRKVVRDEVKVNFRAMQEMLEVSREMQGKETKPYHYSNEALLLNEVLTGLREPINRDNLSVDEVIALNCLEIYNYELIRAEVQYADRKVKLFKFKEDLIAGRIALTKSKKPKLTTLYQLGFLER